jgi:hypothetical protein
MISTSMSTFKKHFEILLEKKKKRKNKNKWSPKKYYKNSTYGFYPYGGIGFGGGYGAGEGGGGDSGGGGGDGGGGGAGG